MEPQVKDATRREPDTVIMDLVNTAREEYNEENYVLCFEALNVALHIRPTITLYLERAALYGNLSAFQLARHDLSIALKGDTGNMSTWTYMYNVIMSEAKSYEESGNYVPAVKLYGSLLRSDFSNDLKVHSKYIEAVMNCFVSLELDPFKDESILNVTPEKDLSELLTGLEKDRNEQKKEECSEQLVLDMEEEELEFNSSEQEYEKSCKHSVGKAKSSHKKYRKNFSSSEQEYEKSSKHSVGKAKSSHKKYRKNSSEQEYEKSCKHSVRKTKSSSKKYKKKSCKRSHDRKTYHRWSRSSKTYYTGPRSASYHSSRDSASRSKSKSTVCCSRSSSCERNSHCHRYFHYRHPSQSSHHSQRHCLPTGNLRSRSRIAESSKAMIRNLVMAKAKKSM